jgi:hypothetical protein
MSTALSTVEVRVLMTKRWYLEMYLNDILLLSDGRPIESLRPHYYLLFMPQNISARRRGMV